MKRTIKLSESDLSRLIKESAKQILGESYLYTNDIDPSDVRVNGGDFSEDGYAEWEASVDNGWYTFRGTYNGIDCELDEIIVGHSGHGHQVDIDDEAIEWFNQNLADKIKSWFDNNNGIQTESKMKRTIRLTESDLHRVISESVKRILKESNSERAAYEALSQAIDDMQMVLATEYDDPEATDLYDLLMQVEEKMTSFFQHPELSPRMKWEGSSF